MVYTDGGLIRPWGYKFGKEITLYCFNNPNSQALFLFLCSLSVWLFCRNKPLRIISVTVLACFSFWLTYGRTFFTASLGLIGTDALMKKKGGKFFSCALMLTPIVVFLVSAGVGLAAQNYGIHFYDDGLLGRFLTYGAFLKKTTLFNFIFGFPEEEIKTPLDGSFFAVFVIMGFFMPLYLLARYIKYIKRHDDRYGGYIPAVAGIVLAGLTESSLAFFSINTVLLITLLAGPRRTGVDRRNNYCPRI
jgi:hypothetical protein